MKHKILQNRGGFCLAVALIASLYGCSKSGDSLPQPQQSDEVQISKAQKDPTGQYVDKSVQVTGYEDGRERPTRVKKDKIAKYIGGGVSNILMPEEPTSDDPNSGGGGGYSYFTGVGAYKFVSSVGRNLDGGDKNPGLYILDLEISKGSSSSSGAQPGYDKLDIDLNSGAGGKYIYLCFSRKTVESHGWCRPSWADITPVSDITVKAWRTFSDAHPPADFCNIPEPTNNWFNRWNWECDLNDGSGGRYIYSYLSKAATPTPIREVGIVAGNSSNIWPPSGWVRVGDDCNAGAGGDYIYFCYKR